MQPDRQPRSGLAIVKRDFSSNNTTGAPSVPAHPAAPKRCALSDTLRKAIQDGVASREADKASLASLSSQKRSLSPGAVPPPQKRQLPRSWGDFESSSATLPQGSSQSSLYFRSRSSTSSVPPFDMLSHGHQVEPSHSVPPFELKPPQRPPEISLSDEQKYVLQLVLERKNVFYTGSAGTGKSVLLREIIKSLYKRYVKMPDAVAVTASTGIAACNIGGVTIHSFAGIGLGIEDADKLIEKIMTNRKASSRWRRTQVLIIDEISMVDGGLFDKLDKIGRELRKQPNQPFGGIQVVITGDFFQLPPVSKGSTLVRFAFEATTWKETIERAIKLTKVFRQKDEEFVNMLNEMRFGTLSQKSITRFRQLSREITYEDGIGPTELFPRRQDVDNSNNLRMSRLRGESKTYYAKDGGSAGGEQRQKLLDNFMAQQVLHLTIGAQVMLIKNIDETLVNGSMGIVTAFEELFVHDKNSGGKLEEATPRVGVVKALALDEARRKRPVVDFKVPGGGIRQVMLEPETWKVELPNGEVQASRTQYPLILAWAMSIHKSQGQTLDRVKVDLAKVFEKGQAYVALSRATSLDGLQVLNFNPNKVFVHERVKKWSEKLETFKSAIVVEAVKSPIVIEDSDDDDDDDDDTLDSDVNVDFDVDFDDNVIDF